MTGCLWLPMYHDLGLLLTILPFVQGWTMHNFSPLSFIRNPTLWMDLLSRSQAHWSAAPAFAMRLVARKFQEQQRRSNTPPGSLDLSALRKIQVCAEPVPAGTKQLFEQVFQSYGLREDWFKVGYGLAGKLSQHLRNSLILFPIDQLELFPLFFDRTCGWSWLDCRRALSGRKRATALYRCGSGKQRNPSFLRMCEDCGSHDTARAARWTGWRAMVVGPFRSGRILEQT